MRKSVLPWRMTCFKFSELTRAMIDRVRDTRNNANLPTWYKQHLTNTDVIRQLLQEECKRLDDAAKIAAEPTKRPVKQSKTKSKKVGKK